jgi:arylsulfatase A-like enzyme
MRSIVRVACLLCIAVVLSCGSGDRPLNVLLIGIDTLRPDHLGCYGYERDTSPAIDELAGEGVLFENTVSQSPWTLPSFATVLTSLYPNQHGAMTIVTRVRSSIPTLATVLKQQGYATGAVVNASVLRPEFGLDRGFDFYDPTPPKGRRADETTRDVLEWIDRNKNGPFLMFAHYFDPHEPYDPPAPYDTRFDPDYAGRIGDSFVLHDHFPGVVGTQFNDLRALSNQDWDHIRALYDGEIAFADQAVGRLLRGLEDRGLRDNTLIVFLSDHGEEFFEHEGFGHGHSLYSEVIRVPLMFSLPGTIARGKVVRSQARLVDVMPTILEILGITADLHLEGTSLLPLLTGRGTVTAGPGRLFAPQVAYTEGLLHGPEQKGIISHPWKLIYDFRTREERLFNLDQDPAETRNLVDSRPKPLALLEGMIFTTIFGTSRSWHLELAGSGTGNTFDATVEIGDEYSISRIYLYKFIDSNGRIVDVDPPPVINEVGSALRIEGLRTDGRIQLTFGASGPSALPARFDISIDGSQALQRTFIGESLRNPTEMPFAAKWRRVTVKSPRGPMPRPTPPYVLVWHSEPQYTGDTAVKMDEGTKRELRALGYIQ